MLGNVNNSCAANHNIMYQTPLYFLLSFWTLDGGSLENNNKRDGCLLSAHYMPGTEPSAFLMDFVIKATNDYLISSASHR